MKKNLCFLFVLLFLLPNTALAGHDVVLPYPVELQIHMEPETWQTDKYEVSVDIPITYSEKINAVLRDDLEILWNRAIEALKAFRDYEDLNIRISSTFRISGTSWAGFQFTARIYQTKLSEHKNYNYEETIWLDYMVSSYDIASEEPLTIKDVFSDEETLKIISKEAADFLERYYPSSEHNTDAMLNLTQPETIMNMPFLPGAGRFILFFPLEKVIEKYQIAPFVLYYTDYQEAMTEQAKAQTDNSARPVIALTYDDGPSLGLTKNLLRSLDCFGASATFFPIGEQMNKWGDVVRCEADAGHSIGCHTMHHKYAHRIYRDEGLFTDRDECIEQHLNLLGIEPKLFRAPGGSEKKYLLYKVGWSLIHWSQTASDTGNDPYMRTATRISNQAENGNIILMHDIHKNSVKSADIYLSELYERGFMFATVEELLSINGVALEPNHIYSTGFGIDTVREKINGSED